MVVFYACMDLEFTTAWHIDNFQCESLALAFQDFTHQIEKAIQNSKVVIVCSEVLHTALILMKLLVTYSYR